MILSPLRKAAWVFLLGASVLWSSGESFATTPTECDILAKALRDDYLATSPGKDWLENQRWEKVVRQDAPEIAQDFQKAKDLIANAIEEQRTIGRAVADGTLTGDSAREKAAPLLRQLDSYFADLNWADCGSLHRTAPDDSDEWGSTVRCHKEWTLWGDYAPPKAVFAKHFSESGIYRVCIDHSNSDFACFDLTLKDLFTPGQPVTANSVFETIRKTESKHPDSPEAYVGAHLPSDCPGYTAPAVPPGPSGALNEGPQAWLRNAKGSLSDEATADFDTRSVRSHSGAHRAQVAPNRSD